MTTPRIAARRKTHCCRGHELTKSNVYLWNGNGRRQCRLCIALRAKDYRRRLVDGRNVVILERMVKKNSFPVYLKKLNEIKGTLKAGDSLKAYQQLCAYIDWFIKQDTGKAA